MAHYEPPHQDLRCLQIQLFSSLVVKELNNLPQKQVHENIVRAFRLGGGSLVFGIWDYSQTKYLSRNLFLCQVLLIFGKSRQFDFGFLLTLKEPSKIAKDDTFISKLGLMLLHVNPLPSRGVTYSIKSYFL